MVVCVQKNCLNEYTIDQDEVKLFSRKVQVWKFVRNRK